MIIKTLPLLFLLLIILPHFSLSNDENDKQSTEPSEQPDDSSTELDQTEPPVRRCLACGIESFDLCSVSERSGQCYEPNQSCSTIFYKNGTVTKVRKSLD